MSSISILGFALEATAPIKSAMVKSIFGIGPQIAKKVCAECGISGSTKVEELRETQILELTKHLSKMKIDKLLRDEINANIGRKIEIKSYEGLRHKEGLPVHGQNTRSNAQIAKKLNRFPRYYT
ncbi:hypothetical protein FOG51_02052 [Hanseniaspora uvarum]|jgi:small subunit ribosomal protein S13|uniref:37S ribosomal protein subunit sws2, mitochondrial n=1 Tax=Hanseniaspora uvarum TaxID=29833 RepID=A0A1E5RQT7_HANUV|nr:hypothetical protein FOG48_03423 [Hanseniaspora uvarum]KKA01489.1 37S ribosomal protein SWS2, mitochondrial [Hanseniaspora uvarum DSM 2768]KAF0273176.1 hypothetical protein FOG51_02052 [Hanseniaspora uvarum]KAF0276577.1 hypothetical protein FOG50_02556 [Hanseniaspora uvarum]OEJ89254.1 37S ribosomal protein subunit sws2, mitochondrial [Hanseniaspora uvarum]